MTIVMHMLMKFRDIIILKNTQKPGNFMKIYVFEISKWKHMYVMEGAVYELIYVEF